MTTNTVLVKNMVCHRCVMAVENILQQQAIQFNQVIVGEIHLANDLSAKQEETLKSSLEAIGLEWIGDKKSGTIEKIKQLVIRKARKEVTEEDSKLKLSAYISKHLHNEYTHLSALFSSVEGRTIENFYIQQRVEKVKELLVYNQMTLLDIAVELDYSSVAHLSAQFKQVTGLTPSHFKKVGSAKRKLLDQV